MDRAGSMAGSSKPLGRQLRSNDLTRLLVALTRAGIAVIEMGLSSWLVGSMMPTRRSNDPYGVDRALVH